MESSNFYHKKSSQSYQLKENIQNHLKRPKDITFPLNCSDFKEMITTTNIFIDKTMFIKEIIDKEDKFMLITRPHKWGKSLNLSMLYYFFNKVVDHEGQTIDPSPNRVLFEGGKIRTKSGEIKQLTPLSIAKDPDWQNKYRKYQGAYPVIFMSWKNVKPKTCVEAKKQLCQEFLKVCRQNLYLNNYQLIDWIRKFEQVANPSFEDNQYSQNLDIQNGITLLTQLLKQYHKRDVFILIDDYDAPFNYMLEQQMNTPNDKEKINIRSERANVLLMIKYIVHHSFEKNQNFEKAISTGFYDIFKRQQRFKQNKVSLFKITKKDFNSSFGFSQGEIENDLIQKMFKTQDETLRQVLLSKVKQWYNGYCIPVGKGVFRQRYLYQQVYNPFSVINYLGDCFSQRVVINGKSYWSQSVSDSLLKYFFSSYFNKKLIGNVLQLDSIEPTEMQYREDPILNDLDFSKEISGSYMAHLLFNSGYLTGQLESKSLLYALIPNKQTYNTFQDVFKRWAKEKNLFSDLSYINLENPALLKKKMLVVFNQTQDYIGWKNMKVFNNLFAIYYSLSSDKRHCVYGESQAGRMCINNIFLPTDSKSNASIIHEYKYIHNPKNQEDQYDDTLWQIFQKGYLQHPLSQNQQENHIQKIIVRPIVIVSDQSSKQLNLFMKEDQVYSISQAALIHNFFLKQETKNILKLKNVFRQENISRQALLKHTSVKNIHELLQNIIANQKPEKDEKKPNENKETNSSEKKQLMTESKENQLQVKKMDLKNSLSIDLKAENFDYNKVGTNLPRIGNQWFKKSGNDDSVTQRFKQRFKNGKSLFDCSMNDLQQVKGIGAVLAKEIYDSLQEMKTDPEYFGVIKI